ncbi:TnsA endonuclease N-terminal domain-containing protein [Flavobacterium oreochromis]|uniref:TnsA endonuclease N-terminal domain-containing protein n=1 Tax=Flavobacterium oreochromis TaxID=2906078 RepID=UPI00385AC88A
MILKFKKRVRDIGFKASSLSGQICSTKINKPIQFESSLERDFIYLLEFDRKVSSYLEQPVEIIYTDSKGKKRKYTPDFIVTYHDKFKKTEIIEIKYESELLKKKGDLEEKFECARKYCIENGFVFKVISDKYIRDEKHVLLKNFKFLSRYRDFFDKIDYIATGIHFDTSYACILLDKVEEIENCTINKLVSSITNDWEKKAELIFLTWYLIANNFIECDLNSPLRLNSIIWKD